MPLIVCIDLILSLFRSDESADVVSRIIGEDKGILVWASPCKRLLSSDVYGKTARLSEKCMVVCSVQDLINCAGYLVALKRRKGGGIYRRKIQKSQHVLSLPDPCLFVENYKEHEPR